MSSGHDHVPETGIMPPTANMSPDEIDAAWLKNVYQGDSMPQLTVRAVLMGGLLGMLMAAANLYTTLSIGWAFGIAITSCVLSYVIWNLVRAFSGGGVSQMSVLENACMASTASAAGYSTGSTIATMFGALVLLAPIPEGKTAADVKTWDVTAPWVVTLFTLCTGLMGVFLAIPMKRQQINHEQLPFPSGTAAAETLRSLYSASKEAVLKAYVLVVGLFAGLVLGVLRAGDDVLEKLTYLSGFFEWMKRAVFNIRIPAEIEMPFIGKFYPRGMQPNGFAFEPSALLIAAGMIVGMRISVSLLVSSLLLYFVAAPYLAEQDAAVMEKPVIAAMSAAQGAARPDQTPVQAAQAAAQAAIDSMKASGLDVAAVTTAADGVVKQLSDAAAKQLEEKTKKGIAVAEPSATEKAAAATAAGQAVAAAIARPAGDTAAAAAKYKASFRWEWAGHQVVITRWSLWGGTSVMVFASLMSVALQWRTVARAFMGVRGGGSAAELARIEVPGSWMVMGMVPITIAMVWLQIQAFGVSWYAGLIAVGMSFVLSLVASRATGETDTTPIGAMGKVMQLMFAVLAPQNIGANLASAGIAANSASSSADLLTDLKTGYLLGANPRRQFLAQFFGVFFGTVAIVPIWYLMVPTREKLESFALPSTRAWEAVARVLVNGISELPSSAVIAIFGGAAIGVLLPLLERVLPAKARQYAPSATGIGLAWVMPFQNAFSFFLGAVIAMLWTRSHRRSADLYNVPVASGLIAGESLVQAFLAIAATLVGLIFVS